VVLLRAVAVRGQAARRSCSTIRASFGRRSGQPIGSCGDAQDEPVRALSAGSNSVLGISPIADIEESTGSAPVASEIYRRRILPQPGGFAARHEAPQAEAASILCITAVAMAAELPADHGDFLGQRCAALIRVAILGRDQRPESILRSRVG
jgi:hypothetical protein